METEETKIVSSFESQNKFKGERIMPSYLTGIKTLDELTSGFYDGQVVVVSGWTKCGKTSLCQTLTRNFSRREIGCLWFTYELSMREFIRKFPEGMLPLYYWPEELKGSSLDWIERCIKQSIALYDAKIVFIDHLHYLVPLGTAEKNLSILIGGIMRELKKMAVRNNVVIFVLAHTTKIPAGQTPNLSHLRDSSFIAQESDIAMMINRPDYEEGDPLLNSDKSAKLRVLSNRKNGNRGLINLSYLTQFYEEV